VTHLHYIVVAISLVELVVHHWRLLMQNLPYPMSAQLFDHKESTAECMFLYYFAYLCVLDSRFANAYCTVTALFGNFNALSDLGVRMARVYADTSIVVPVEFVFVCSHIQVDEVLFLKNLVTRNSMGYDFINGGANRLGEPVEAIGRGPRLLSQNILVYRIIYLIKIISSFTM